MGSSITPRRRAPFYLAVGFVLVVTLGCSPQPAPTATLAAPTGGPVVAPSPSALRYPTLPPEWTATPFPTLTHTPLPPTPTRTGTPVPTLAFTVTAAVAGAIFTGTAGVNQPLALGHGLYRVDWEYIGPANSAFAVRLASPDSNTTITFVDGQGYQRGASDLRIIGAADLLLAVEAAGPWVVIIQPVTGARATPPTPTPLTPSPAPT